MASELERVREWIREAEEFARTYVFEMTDDYRALIERVEALPRNQPGADKSCVIVGSQGNPFTIEARADSRELLLHVIETKWAAGRDKDKLFLATHKDALEQLFGKRDDDRS